MSEQGPYHLFNCSVRKLSSLCQGNSSQLYLIMAWQLDGDGIITILYVLQSRSYKAVGLGQVVA